MNVFVLLEGPRTLAWRSGKVAMTFGQDQFQPSGVCVSPGEPAEVINTLDGGSHEINLYLSSDPESPREDFRL